MATFGKATYNAAKYASIRPTYPRQLYDSIFRYHEGGSKARWTTAVDLGCGTGEWRLDLSSGNFSQLCGPGQATTELTPFQKVIGVDPSAKMVEQATQSIAAGLPNQIEYVQSAAETLPFLADGSVDMITSGLRSKHDSVFGHSAASSF